MTYYVTCEHQTTQAQYNADPFESALLLCIGYGDAYAALRKRRFPVRPLAVGNL